MFCKYSILLLKLLMFWLDVLSRQVHDLLCNPLVKPAVQTNCQRCTTCTCTIYTEGLGARLQGIIVFTWTTNKSHLPKKNRPRCYAKSPNAWDAFQPIPGLISCTEVTGRWGLLSPAQNASICEDCYSRYVPSYACMGKLSPFLGFIAYYCNTVW